MMTLRRYPTSEIWHYQCQINGKKWSRSTGEADRKKAMAKVPKLEALAKLHRQQPGRLLKLSQAIVTEIDRTEIDVSEYEAKRRSSALRNFLDWLERDITLEKIDTNLLENYQRERLRVAALNTVNRELYAMTTLLKKNGFTVKKPDHKPGRRTLQRGFTQIELKRFFAACREERHKSLFLVLLATGARPR
jgi:hypothetical protein